MKMLKNFEEQRRWYIYAVMVVAYIISNFHQIGLSAISGEVGTALRTDAASLALLASAFAYPYAAMQIPVGLLSDTLGPRKSVSAAMLLVFAGTLLFSFARNMETALAARVCIGMGTAVIVVPLMKLTAVWFSPAHFGRLLAIAFTIGAFGLVAATSPMAWLSGLVSWRSIYLVLALIALASAISIWLVVRDAPASGKVQEGMLPSGKPGRFDPAWLRTALCTVFRNRQVWLLGGWCFCQAGIYFAFIGLWGGQFLTKGLGVDVLEAGWILTLPACGVMAGPAFTWAAERCGSGKKVLFGLSVATVLFSLPLALGLPRLPSAVLSLYFTCLGVVTISGTVLIFSMAKDLFPVKYAGTVSGVINIFPFSGTAVVQQIMGLVLDFQAPGTPVYDSFCRAFWAMSATALAALIICLWIREPEKIRLPA